MTAFDALATAIRERLISGRPAPLPGLGTLVRQHVSARIEERPDGTRVLLPPGETIGLAETEASHESLASAFGRLQALPEAEADSAYTQAMDQLEAHLSATGEVRLPGVGLLRRTSGGVVLGVEAGLLAAVNQAFEGLTPVGADPTQSSPATPSVAPAPAGADAPNDPDPVTLPEANDADDPLPASETAEIPLDEIDEEPEVDAPDTVPMRDDPAEPPASEVESASDVDAPQPVAAPEAVNVEAASEDAEAPEDVGPAIAVPFDDDPANVLPPSSPEADPSLRAAAADEAAPVEDEDWESETWTAGATPPPTDLLGAKPQHIIEDADFEVLPPGPTPRVETVSPEAEMDAMFAAPPPPAPVVETVPPAVAALAPDTPAVAAEETAPSGSATGWIVGVVLIALLAALAFWLWSSTSDAEGTTAQEPVPTTVVAPTPDAGATEDDDTEGASADADDASATDSETPPSPTAPGDDAASAAPATTGVPAPAATPPQASTPATAVSPPRLDGLDDGDRRALAGGPIDPAMGGWTIVIASLRSEEAANDERDLWAEAGYRTGVFPPSERGQTRYRVGIGQFGSEDHARRLRERLPPRAPADAWLLNLRSL